MKRKHAAACSEEEESSSTTSSSSSSSSSESESSSTSTSTSSFSSTSNSSTVHVKECGGGERELKLRLVDAVKKLKAYRASVDTKKPLKPYQTLEILSLQQKVDQLMDEIFKREEHAEKIRKEEDKMYKEEMHQMQVEINALAGRNLF